MGSPDFAVPSLEALLDHHEVALVVTQPDRRAGRGKRVAAPAVKTVAVERGTPVLQPRKRTELLEAIANSGAELGVVVAYGRILPKDVLEAFPRGCINVHASLLPAYRGAAPIQWAVINNEETSGVCIMQLDEGMDTGPVYASSVVTLAEDETAGSLFARLAPLGAELLLEVLEQMEKGIAVATPQDHDKASMAPMLKKADGEVDWSKDAALVASHIRGVDPWPGAFTEQGGDRIKLFGARDVDGSGRPGEILGVGEHGLEVACGRGACAIAELQAPGRKRLDAAAFVAGRRLEPGTILGGE
jgi:methionyl-tRNA formyltransferase